MEKEALSKNLLQVDREKVLIEQLRDGLEMARVVAEHRERYLVAHAELVLQSEITGQLRFAAQAREDFPAVGDWVGISVMDDDFAIIHQVLPRYSTLKRKAVAKFGQSQIIATNIDYAFIVQAVGHDFNLARLERYLTICHSARIDPIVILTKIDLIDQVELASLYQHISSRIQSISIVAVSNVTGEGLDQIRQLIQPGYTYCFLGSSGVGKSTIINHLKGSAILKTAAISSATDKGRHTTSHRELVPLAGGSYVIDTPGMREVGVTDDQTGIQVTYEKILDFASKCKFSDCSHTSETGCAVLLAIEQGEISESTYHNFQKLQRETARFSANAREIREKGRQQGKLYKRIQKERRKNKY
ncbi:MAG: ribosome small subunit-dependent GTPase A [Saprospiraceae bacterium]|nr:ribosome small subunit-dependent GTPase A [Saprospiraceae bacterium]